MLIEKIISRILLIWARFWMRFAGRGSVGRFFTRISEFGMPPFYERSCFADLRPHGYISSRAQLYGSNILLGANVFIDDRVFIYECWQGGSVTLADSVRLYRDTVVQFGQGGRLSIGEGTTVQPRCQFSAYKGAIEIGRKVQIAPNCAFYSYNHTYERDMPIDQQPLYSAGGIIIEDGVWLGFGVIVLDGVKIGKGAVIGAGSVVCHDIPEYAIATGHPAKVLDFRS